MDADSPAAVELAGPTCPLGGMHPIASTASDTTTSVAVAGRRCARIGDIVAGPVERRQRRYADSRSTSARFGSG